VTTVKRRAVHKIPPCHADCPASYQEGCLFYTFLLLLVPVDKKIPVFFSVLCSRGRGEMQYLLGQMFLSEDVNAARGWWVLAGCPGSRFPALRFPLTEHEEESS